MEASSLKKEKEIVGTMGCLGIVRVFAANVFDSSEAQVYFASNRFLLRQTCNNQTPYKMTVG